MKIFIKFFPIVLLSLLAGCEYLAPIIFGSPSAQSVSPTSDAQGLPIDCSNQTIMSKQDCILGKHVKGPMTQGNINILKEHGVTTPEQYDQAFSEANKYNEFASSSDANPQTIWSTVISYLNVKAWAQNSNETVEQWLIEDNEKKAVEKKELAKKYPYTAELTCTIYGRKTEVSMCFSPSSEYSSGTELELTNGKDYHMYQFIGLEKAGFNINGVLTIRLRKAFMLTVQNSSNIGLLNVIIKKSGTDEIVFRKSIGQFDVIKVQN